MPAFKQRLFDNETITGEMMTDDAEIDEVLGERPDVWIFGYGSLMWDPGFDPAETRPALVRGLCRRFCVASTRYRGTPDRPGLLLGLDRGGSCRGTALRVPPARCREILSSLWEREMNGRVYRPAMIPATLTDDGSRIEALAFIVDRSHPQRVADMDDDARVRRILAASGDRGTNLEYVLETARALEESGARDATVARLVAALKKEALRRSAEGDSFPLYPSNHARD